MRSGPIRRLLCFVAAALVALAAGDGALARRRGGGAPAGDQAPQFASRDKWIQHFQKHGAEVGAKTAEEYLELARGLLRGGDGVETFQRGEDTLYYRRSTNEFGVTTRKNVIRTYFKPAAGVRYWERNKARGSGGED